MTGVTTMCASPEIARLAIHCTASTGEVGSFIFKEKCENTERYIPVSPVFPSCAQAFDWLQENGWVSFWDQKWPVGSYRKES